MYFIHQRGTANGAYTAMVMTGVRDNLIRLPFPLFHH